MPTIFSDLLSLFSPKFTPKLNSSVFSNLESGVVSLIEQEAWDAAQSIVATLKDSTLSGSDKKKAALRALRAQFYYLSEKILGVAIETALLKIKASSQ